jgi:hypothetical protein
MIPHVAFAVNGAPVDLMQYISGTKEDSGLQSFKTPSTSSKKVIAS